jgi:predicted ATPase
MLKQITFENWKSFRNTTLHIEPLTMVIGAKGSGKTNALEALAFLSHTAQGKNVRESLKGDSTQIPIRGGIEAATFKSTEQFILTVWVQHDTEPNLEYLYSVVVEPASSLVVAEKLVRTEYSDHNQMPQETTLIDIDLDQDQHIVADYDLQTRGLIGRLDRIVGLSGLFTALGRLEARLPGPMITVLETLRHIMTLAPRPAPMRAASRLSARLRNDGANLAGVIAYRPPEERRMVEAVLSSCLSRLPITDLQRVWVEPVGDKPEKAIIYGEPYTPSGTTAPRLDAAAMSDVALRCLAMLTAVLTVPPGSLLALEDVDLHMDTAQAALLIHMLRDLAHQQSLGVIVTTDNPAILTRMPSESIPLVNVVQRNFPAGESLMTLPEDIESIPKLMENESETMERSAARSAIQRSFARIKKGRVAARAAIERSRVQLKKRKRS